MSQFTTPLIVEYIDGTNWKLHEEFSYYLKDNEDEIITVPKGYITDFASVPKILRLVAKNHELFNKASILHDFLYETQEYSKEEADIIYKDAMEVFGVTEGRANLYYLVVKFFGHSSWEEYEDKLSQEID